MLGHVSSLLRKRAPCGALQDPSTHNENSLYRAARSSTVQGEWRKGHDEQPRQQSTGPPGTQWSDLVYNSKQVVKCHHWSNPTTIDNGLVLLTNKFSILIIMKGSCSVVILSTTVFATPWWLGRPLILEVLEMARSTTLGQNLCKRFKAMVLRPFEAGHSLLKFKPKEGISNDWYSYLWRLQFVG